MFDVEARVLVFPSRRVKPGFPGDEGSVGGPRPGRDIALVSGRVCLVNTFTFSVTPTPESSRRFYRAVLLP